jgi:hypothetical protein
MGGVLDFRPNKSEEKRIWKERKDHLSHSGSQDFGSIERKPPFSTRRVGGIKILV